METQETHTETEIETTEKAPVEEVVPKRRRSWLGSLFTVLLLAGLVAAGVAWFLNQPAAYETQTITIEKGDTAADVALRARQAGVVRSESLLYVAMVLVGDPSTIKAGDFVVEEGLSTFAVARQLTSETPQDTLVSVTVPEGVTVAEIAATFKKELPAFDSEVFLTLAAEAEGYLWPETYFVPKEFDAEAAYALLKETAEKERAEIFATASSTLPVEKVIILASIVEREANTPESMKMVAGILQNRLDIGMPLQADATIEYIIDGKIKDLPAGELAALLEESTSPYNSYKYTGLPPTAISNPGHEALLAVLQPTPSDYLYYITDEEGNFHYATGYIEHLENVERYLR